MQFAITPHRISICHSPVARKCPRSIVPKKISTSHENNRKRLKVDRVEILVPIASLTIRP